MKLPRSFPFLTVLFAVVYTIAYVIAVWKNYALFTYHPAINEITLGVRKPFDGPAMYWYGWMATAGVVAFGACLIACLVPERVASRLWSGWSWVIPLCVLFVLAYLLRSYFLR